MSKELKTGREILTYPKNQITALKEASIKTGAKVEILAGPGQDYSDESGNIRMVSEGRLCIKIEYPKNQGHYNFWSEVNLAEKEARKAKRNHGEIISIRKAKPPKHIFDK
jgi:hypothetical protein